MKEKHNPGCVASLFQLFIIAQSSLSIFFSVGGPDPIWQDATVESALSRSGLGIKDQQRKHAPLS